MNEESGKQLKIQTSRSSKFGSLVNVRNLGFYPRVVFDVGAQIGTFELYSLFPESKHILIEPVQENEPALKKICSHLQDAHYFIAAAASQTGTVKMCITKNFQYSSITGGDRNCSNDHIYRNVPSVRLDDICGRGKLSGPYLIKIDVDGKEIAVLQGATETLKASEYVIVEATLFVQLYDVMDFMRSQDFVAYDFVDHMYRPSDGALWQVDIAFVKKNGIFRRNRSFGLP
jgi:FkbM family methyltransferase